MASKPSMTRCPSAMWSCNSRITLKSDHLRTRARGLVGELQGLGRRSRRSARWGGKRGFGIRFGSKGQGLSVPNVASMLNGSGFAKKQDNGIN